MIRLVVNADDFGLSRGVNHGIIDAHRYGIVNSTTLLVNMPGVDHAVELAKQNPKLGVGIHLTLTCGKPICSNVPSLVDEQGFFKFNRTDTSEGIVIKIEDVKQEWEAQIEKFLSFGITPTHFDSHHHVHGWPMLLPVVQYLSQKYQLPVRNLFSQKAESLLLFTDHLTTDFFGEKVHMGFFSWLVDEVKDETSVEVMVHPAYVDNMLKKLSSYCEKRLEELDILTQVTLDKRFELVGF